MNFSAIKQNDMEAQEDRKFTDNWNSHKTYNRERNDSIIMYVF
jgi:hypothetical protein